MSIEGMSRDMNLQLYSQMVTVLVDRVVALTGDTEAEIVDSVTREAIRHCGWRTIDTPDLRVLD